MELRLVRLNAPVATDQGIGLAHGSQLQKNDAVSVADVRQAIGRGVDLDGLYGRQKIGEQRHKQTQRLALLGADFLQKRPLTQ